MRRRMYDRSVTWVRGLVLSSVAIFAASCSATTDGVAEPPERGVTGSETDTTAPQRTVSDPLDITPYLSEPCDLVSPEMLEDLGTSPEQAEPILPEDDELAAQTGPLCRWSGEAEGSIALGIDSGNRERGLGGLKGLEVSRDQGRYKLWEEVSVAGYPAVYLGVRDARADGDCDLAVGIADDMTFGVTAHSFYDNPERACDVANELAADVIQTLKGER
ncbi:DUF3558 domain-containing protein [Saccharomonospora azurea]|uniref:DUF3558 domain-containing protein n=1 Tax=Saccharomonospora azurea TaxID=40988 RepID=UPI003D91C904